MDQSNGGKAVRALTSKVSGFRVQGSGLALLLTALTSWVTGAEPSLGFSLYGMKSLALEQAVKTCAELGYEHVELALNPGYATEPTAFGKEARSALKKQLAGLKLTVPCLMVNLSLTADDKGHAAALQTLAAAAELAHELNAEQPPVLETVLGGKPALWEAQKIGMATRLKDWAAAAEKAKVSLALKAHVGSAVNSPERLLWLLEQVPSSALCVAYDFSHFELQKMDMEQSMVALLPRTRFIHVKDGKWEEGGKKFQFLLPGEGETDYAKYFQLLKKHGYSGPVCVEVSGQIFNKPGYDPVTAAKSCYEVLAKAREGAR
jgi:sugar phosphate isomerase/epimerase